MFYRALIRIYDVQVDFGHGKAWHLKMASSVKSDDLVSRVLAVNDVDLKEIEGHESEKVNKTSSACVPIQTIEMKRFYGKIWKEREGDAIV